MLFIDLSVHLENNLLIETVLTINHFQQFCTVWGGVIIPPQGLLHKLNHTQPLIFNIKG